MTRQEEVRVLTREAFSDLLKSVHLHPMERESDLVDVEVAGYLRRLNLKGVVIKANKAIPNEILCEDGSIAWIEPITEVKQ